MENTKEFPKGIIIKSPHEKAPEFVVGNLSIKRMEALEWIDSKEGDWINIDIKKSQEGKLYLEVNNWKPVAEKKTPGDIMREAMGDPVMPQNIPF